MLSGFRLVSALAIMLIIIFVSLSSLDHYDIFAGQWTMPFASIEFEPAPGDSTKSHQEQYHHPATEWIMTDIAHAFPGKYGGDVLSRCLWTKNKITEPGVFCSNKAPDNPEDEQPQDAIPGVYMKHRLFIAG